MDGYKWQKSWEVGVISYTEKQSENMDLSSSKGCELINGLWIEIRGQTSVGEMLAGPSKKEEEIGFRQPV